MIAGPLRAVLTSRYDPTDDEIGVVLPVGEPREIGGHQRFRVRCELGGRDRYRALVGTLPDLEDIAALGVASNLVRERDQSERVNGDCCENTGCF